MLPRKPTKRSVPRRIIFGKGGSTRMFKKQAAGTDRPGNTGKDQTAAPGSKRASGGAPPRVHGGLSQPALPGQTAPDGVRRR
jgi:hypothetical protein